MSAEQKFSVIDMAKELGGSGEEVANLFAKKNPEPTQQPVEKTEQPTDANQKKKWEPDKSLLSGMPEVNNKPVTYAKGEIKMEGDSQLKNISDDNAIKDSLMAKNDLERKEANIEAAKRRHKISHLHIPEGQYQVLILAAAGDTDYDRAQAGIDEIFEQIKVSFPEWIEYVPEQASSEKSENKEKNQEAKQTPTPVNNQPQATTEKDTAELSEEDQKNEEGSNIGITIDKSQAPTIAWSPEEVEKIRKSRKVQLNIVEGKDLEYGKIIDVDDNAVDSVLEPYIRKSNDIVTALPASKYRCTITGLSYPEVIDLTNSQELNDIDGEHKKWSIAFNHIKNPSIGAWKEYSYYIDPTTKQKVIIDTGADIPAEIDQKSIVNVSKFADFVSKTSFIDIDFILWKVLCATSMDEEIITIDCHALIDKINKKQCGHSYDWIYRPTELLDIASISPAVLADMEHTMQASTKEAIADVYKSSMLNLQNTVELPTSKIKVVFGHISGYEYLNDVYIALNESQDISTIASQSLNYTTMTVVKAFLIPTGDGRYKRIKGARNLIKVINQLDEIDWQTLAELVRIMIEPYQFRYSLRNIVCPKCKNRSMIPIESIKDLLFIVARSLSSVLVELKKI